MLDAVSTALSTLLILAVVLYLTYIISKHIGKAYTSGFNSKYIKTIDRIAVGQDKAIAIIEVMDEYLLVGIASDGITLLDKLGREKFKDLPLEGNTPSGNDFSKIIDKMMKRGKGE